MTSTTTTAPAIDSPEAQRITRDYLEGCILLCVSTAVHEMHTTDAEEFDTFDLYRGPIDLDEFVKIALEDMNAEDITNAAYNYTEYRGPTDEDEAQTREEWEEQVRIARRCIVADLDADPDNQELIDALEVESSAEIVDYEAEVYEHYAVSGWFGRQLAQAGETVTEFMGWNVWSRTTTGQSICLDNVVQSIALEAHSERAQREAA